MSAKRGLGRDDTKKEPAGGQRDLVHLAAEARGARLFLARAWSC